MSTTYHIPVMPTESVMGLALRIDSDVIDATFGGGGHSRLILEKIPKGRLFAFDQDKDATNNAIDDKRFTLIRHNFRYLENFLRYYHINKVDAILADFGVSSHDFDVAERGFSFRFDSDLDMRMNRDAQKSALQVINEYSEEQLISIFRMYGETKNAHKLVAQIVKERKQSNITTTQQLKEIAKRCTSQRVENKYLSQVFQALRIEVNDEIEALKEFLQASLKILQPGGRIVAITYHSLEDRICKNFFRSGNFEGKIEKDFYGNVNTPFKLINRKVITPSEKELRGNPRSRSAKLRIAERIQDGEKTK